MGCLVPKELEQEPKLERLARISAELASHNKEVKIYVRENWESLKGVEPLGRGRQQCGEWVRAERIVCEMCCKSFIRDNR